MLPFLDAGTPIAVAMSALYALLAIASLSVRIATRKSGPVMLRDQVDAWWCIFPIVTLALLTYPLGVVALACFICQLAFLELAPYYPGTRPMFWSGAGAIVLATVTCQLWLPDVRPWLPWLLGALTLAQATLFWYRPAATALVRLLMTATLGAMLMLTRFADLAAASRVGLGWLFYLFVITALNDIGQFVAGKLFGRTRLAPTVSPNKTWQGFAGGVVVSQFASLALGTYLDLATPAALMAAGLLLSTGGLVGDLLFSAAKRYLAIKDFSALIPGHGGILDRVDSLVITAPLLYLLLSIAIRIT
jgi:phosphatidate cytidylyltransferase